MTWASTIIFQCWVMQGLSSLLKYVRSFAECLHCDYAQLPWCYGCHTSLACLMGKTTAKATYTTSISASGKPASTHQSSPLSWYLHQSHIELPHHFLSDWSYLTGFEDACAQSSSPVTTFPRSCVTDLPWGSWSHTAWSQQHELPILPLSHVRNELPIFLSFELHNAWSCNSSTC